MRDVLVDLPGRDAVRDFQASDGVLTARRTAAITANPSWDAAGDGMTDTWELEHFGDL